MAAAKTKPVDPGADAKTPWDYVCSQLPLLHCVGAAMSCINGGSILETTFFFSNRAGIDCHPTFTGTGKAAWWGLSAPGFVKELKITNSPWRQEKAKGKKAKLCIEVETEPGGRGERTRGERTRGWSSHESALREIGFGDDALKHAEAAMLACHI